MMILPNPGVLDTLIRDRQKQLRTPATRPAKAGIGLRVRIGHAMIVAGSTLSGERVERPAPPSAIHNAA
jgi:hypothetical protein